MQLREDDKTAKASIVLVGTVSSTLSFSEIPVVVAAYSKKDDKRTIVHYTTLHEPGPYELMVPVGIHNIVAFFDKNKNLIFEKGEPAGQILTAEKVSTPAGGVAGNLDIVLLEQNHTKIDFPVGFQIQPKAHKKLHSTSPGAIAQMDDFLFSDEYGEKGFWAGLEFFKEVGGNVYFLEPYDPEKIPMKEYDFVFIDGPPGVTEDDPGRRGTLYAAWPYLSTNTIIVLDDAHRPGEQQTVLEWMRVFGEILRLQYLNLQRSAFLMERNAPIMIQSFYEFPH